VRRYPQNCQSVVIIHLGNCFRALAKLPISKIRSVLFQLPIVSSTILKTLEIIGFVVYIGSYTGTQFEIENAEAEGCNVVTLQWTGETRTIVASRTPAEREKNPDRICLDRRGLTTFPNVIGESKLRLMSLQHNLLTKIESSNLSQLTKLVFLDLYDNQIEKICDFDFLENLRVLLLGKNRIRKIEGLKQLLKLEVLDLHGNQIQQITGLENLSSLKVLNLAGNNIKTVGCNDFQGLISLKELNLRRNKLKRLLGFHETPQLQKLYLSNNDIHK